MRADTYNPIAIVGERTAVTFALRKSLGRSGIRLRQGCGSAMLIHDVAGLALTGNGRGIVRRFGASPLPASAF
jgi:hypothetical protein